MTRRLQTRLCLTNSFLLEYVLLEPGKEILPNRLRMNVLLPLDLAVILVPTYALARTLVSTKINVFALTVARSKFLVSKIRMTDLPVLNPWSRISSTPVTGLSTW